MTQNPLNECPHVLHEKVVPMGSSGGYMVMKSCIICHYTEGFGFIDENHEILTLKNMLDDGII
jgi:hypothetical protein